MPTAKQAGVLKALVFSFPLLLIQHLTLSTVIHAAIILIIFFTKFPT